MADDVPRTLGADGVEYGPFQRGERARLPALNAEILIKRGKARAAQVSQ
jgi:DNA replication initiation complex subunit (GINS family)